VGRETAASGAWIHLCVFVDRRLLSHVLYIPTGDGDFDDDDDGGFFGEWEHQNIWSWPYAHASHRKETRRVKEAKILPQINAGNDAMFSPKPTTASEMGSLVYVWRKELQRVGR
jgi:hypothetical protein